MAKCHELKPGDRVRLVQGAWIGAEGEVRASCMMAAKSKYNPHPRAEQVWVQFDNPTIGFQTDIYDYQLEKIPAKSLKTTAAEKNRKKKPKAK